MSYILPASGDKIVQPEHLVSGADQPVANMRSNEARGPGNYIAHTAILQDL